MAGLAWICEAVFFPLLRHLLWYQMYKPESDSLGIPHKSNLGLSAVFPNVTLQGHKRRELGRLKPGLLIG